MTLDPTAPRGLLRVATPWLVLAGAVLVGVVLLVDLPARPRILAVVNDAAHAPVFGVLAWVMLVALRRLGMEHPWRSAGLAWLMTVAVGIGVEWLQPQIGRDASWNDVITNGLGALCALGLAMGWPALGLSAEYSGTSGLRLRQAALGIAALSALLVCFPVAEAAAAYALRWQRFPMVAAFDSPLDLYFAEGASARLERAALPAGLGQPGDGLALRVESTGGRWPGWGHAEPAADWRQYQTLRADVANPGEAPLRLVVRVHDEAHDQRHQDRYNRTFSIPPRSRQVLSMALAEIAAGPQERELDLERIAGVIVFAPNLPAGQRYYIGRVWLE